MSIPDYTESELWTVRNALKERYQQDIDLELADAQIMLDRITWCPTLFWSAQGANFAIVKIAPDRYRAFFFHQPEHQFGTGIDSYDNIGDCVVSVLRVEADHVRQQAINNEQNPSKADDRLELDDTYTPPLF